MAEERLRRLTMEELIYYEDIGDKYGWVAPLTDEDRAYFTHLRSVYKRMGIKPSKATEAEHKLVIETTEKEFYTQSANSPIRR